MYIRLVPWLSLGMKRNLVVLADFKSVVPSREVREVGSIPTRPRDQAAPDAGAAGVGLLLLTSLCSGR